MKFFFPTIDLDLVRDIRREVPDEKCEGSRVDIYVSLENDKRPYIIEVKKGDRNHHFGQYESAYGIEKDRFGYITNYNCMEGKELGYDVKTWEEFYDHLKDLHIDDEMILGYMEYLKSACGLIKYDKAMNFLGISSIKCFSEMTKKIIEQSLSGVEIRKDRQYCYDTSIHQSFTFRYNETDENWGYALFGLWYNVVPMITIGVNSRSWLSEKILNDKDSNWDQFDYLSKPYNDFFWRKDDVWFELKEPKMKEFNEAKSYEEQVAILQNFFKEVLQYLKKYF